MKLFGEYLIERKLVTPEQLLDVLMLQIASVPSIAEAVHRLKLLSQQQIIQVLAHQTKKHCEFRTAALDLGFWNEQVEGQVAAEIARLKTPIGQLLAKRGYLDFRAVTTALDEYLRTSSAGKREAQASPDAVILSAIQQIPMELLTSTHANRDLTTSAMLNDKKLGVAPPDWCQLKPIDEAMARAFSQLLDETRNQNLRALSERISVETRNRGRAQFSQAAKAIANNLHEVRGIAHFIQAPLTEKLTANAENLLSRAGMIAGQLGDREVEQLTEILPRALDMLFEIKNEIVRTGSELPFWETSGFLYGALCRDLDSLALLFEMLGPQRAAA